MDHLNTEDLKNLFEKLRFRDSAVTLLSVTPTEINFLFNKSVNN